MLRKIFPVIIVLFLSTHTFAQNRSVYTDLTNNKCKTISENEPIAGNYSGECAGAGDYKLAVYDDDARMSLAVISPGKKNFDLNLWGHFGNFSYVGERAEWRMKGKTPVALIVRFNVSDRGDGKTPSSYLMVVKISNTNACVTDIVKPGKSQNQRARKLADSAAGKPCRKVE